MIKRLRVNSGLFRFVMVFPLVVVKMLLAPLASPAVAFGVSSSVGFVFPTVQSK